MPEEDWLSLDNYLPHVSTCTSTPNACADGSFPSIVRTVCDVSREGIGHELHGVYCV